jgi:4-carboxymuconolactone decarboxylase
MTNESAPRIAPLLPPDWGAAENDVMSVLPHGRDIILAGWQAGTPVVGTNLVCTQLRHPALAKAFLTFNAHFFYASKLPARVREIMILRISWLRHAESEFVAHVKIGRRAGLTDVEIERIQFGPAAAGWAPEDADLLQAVDDLAAQARIDDETWTSLARRFDIEQMIELVFIVGCYETLAMALNSFDVQIESGALGLDAATRARLKGR